MVDANDRAIYEKALIALVRNQRQRLGERKFFRECEIERDEDFAQARCF